MLHDSNISNRRYLYILYNHHGVGFMIRIKYHMDAGGKEYLIIDTNYFHRVVYRMKDNLRTLNKEETEELINVLKESLNYA